MSGETTHWIRDVAGTSRRRCAFCADRARYLYEPKTPMCGWHLILFYISLDTEWRG